MLNFAHVMEIHGLRPTETLKLYRHANPDRAFEKHGATLEQLYDCGDLEIYQSAQASKVLGDGLVAFFMAEGGRRSRFLGLNKVIGIHSSSDFSDASKAARDRGFLNENDYWYELERDARAVELIDRLVVEWPATGRHHQWLMSNDGLIKDIPVLELRAAALTRTFPGFGNVSLPFADLQSLVRSDVAGWREALSSVSGIYLISNRKSGDLYVGAAYGSGGIWGRWATYAESADGGNKLMIAGIKNLSLEPSDLRFSVLQTMGSAALEDDCLSAERLWKDKLGPKATTLNGN